MHHFGSTMYQKANECSYWLARRRHTVSQLLRSRSALILQTWFSSSVFQAPQKMLAAVFTWRVPFLPSRAHGTDAVWIVDSSNLWSAFHMRPSELNVLPPHAFQALRQEGCDIAPGLFHDSLPPFASSSLWNCFTARHTNCSLSPSYSILMLYSLWSFSVHALEKRTTCYSNCYTDEFVSNNNRYRNNVNLYKSMWLLLLWCENSKHHVFVLSLDKSVLFNENQLV